METAYICTACGTQFAPSEKPPASCPICEDERQYVPRAGQGWTSLATLRRSHKAVFHYDGEFLGLGSAPRFGIGQRALFVRSPHGNLLWDCIAPIDRATIDVIEGLGGLVGIAISHPHYYTTMVEWSEAFGGVPVHLHADDREWVMRSNAQLDLWDGERREVLPGVTIVRCGGHFPGACVLHVADAAAGKGALLVGDNPQVATDNAHLGFLRSYPNYIPLGEAAVRRIESALDGLAFDAIYGAFWDLRIPTGGREALHRSVERHVAWLARTEDT